MLKTEINTWPQAAPQNAKCFIKKEYIITLKTAPIVRRVKSAFCEAKSNYYG